MGAPGEHLTIFRQSAQMRTAALIFGVFFVVTSALASPEKAGSEKNSIEALNRGLDNALDSTILVEDAKDSDKKNTPAPPKVDKCKDAPSATTAAVLQFFFTGFGAGFIVMQRYDLMGLCMGVIFGMGCVGLGMTLWSVISIAEGNIACGGDYAGCIPQ